MRPVIYVLSFLALMASGFWAYRENYATQGALAEVAGLQDEILGLHEALVLQNAEWAYLNRPDRLRELAALNFDRLGLLPMEPEQLAPQTTIAYPPVAAPLEFSAPIDTLGAVDAATEPDPAPSPARQGEQTP